MFLIGIINSILNQVCSYYFLQFIYEVCLTKLFKDICIACHVVDNGVFGEKEVVRTYPEAKYTNNRKTKK